MYKVTFTYRGYVTGVFYNESRNGREAIESAEMHVVADYDYVRVELVVDDEE